MSPDSRGRIFYALPTEISNHRLTKMGAVHIPRATEITGKKSPDELAAEREWNQARQRILNARSHARGNLSREGWKRIARATRTF